MSKSEEILDYFNILKKLNRLGTSYLFIGEDTSLVLEVIKLINCQNSRRFCDTCWDCAQIGSVNHPDLFIIEPEGFSIKIESIRDGIKFLSLKSFKAKNKALIVKEAQYFKDASANAFLKVLEEPPKNSFIAICTSKLEGLIPTIISRCRKIFLPALNMKAGEPDLSLIDSFLKGQDPVFKDRKEFARFLLGLITVLRDYLVKKTSPQNNQLLKKGHCEIILRSYDFKKLNAILDNVLKVYGAHDTVNINLGLNLIKMGV